MNRAGAMDDLWAKSWRVILIETDPASGWLRWRLQQRQQLPVNVPQRGIMFQQRPVNFREPLENGDVGRELLAHLHEGADDVKAHLNRLRAVQDVGRLKRTMLGESLDALGKFQWGQGCHSL